MQAWLLVDLHYQRTQLSATILFLLVMKVAGGSSNDVVIKIQIYIIGNFNVKQDGDISVDVRGNFLQRSIGGFDIMIHLYQVVI